MASRSAMDFLCLLVLVATVTTRVHGTAMSELQALQKAYFDWRMEEAPLMASVNGLHAWDAKADSYDMTFFSARKAKLDELLGRMSQIPRDSLPQVKQYDWSVLRDQLQTARDGYQWYTYTLTPYNFLEGDQSDPQSWLNRLRFQTLADFNNYVSRLHALAHEINNKVIMMREAIDKGLTYSIHSVERVPEQIAAILEREPSWSVWFLPLNASLDSASSVSDLQKQSLRQQGRAAVEEVQIALTGVRDFFLKEYLGSTRGTAGVGGLQDGARFYAACLQWHLSLDSSPGTVHQTGLTEVARIAANMRQIMAKQGFNGTIAEYFDSLKKNPRNSFTTKEEVLNFYRDLVFKRINPKLDSMFKNIPNITMQVTEMTMDGPPAMYMAGPVDGSRPGQFMVNVHDPADTSAFFAPSVALHEASPGHHLQHIYQASADLPDFRKYDLTEAFYRVPFSFPSYTAYVEGWALYAEFLGEEMGVYQDDYELMGRYSSEIFRACRIVVDTGLHFMGWTRERAIQYMHTYSAFSLRTLELEVDRYITWPGQAAAYKIGELKIKELRQRAQTELGAKFDIRDFHLVLLQNGPLPLTLLEAVVDDWIKVAKGQGQGTHIVG